jgi:hypothetical protein
MWEVAAEAHPPQRGQGRRQQARAASCRERGTQAACLRALAAPGALVTCRPARPSHEAPRSQKAHRAAKRDARCSSLNSSSAASKARLVLHHPDPTPTHTLPSMSGQPSECGVARRPLRARALRLTAASQMCSS